ncbi:hypothetical protein GCM10022403_085710 [Streptomyces coacervatus]|uniref:Uncharacterized protein n=1 Tax=Streptomyces coacervatus TaxID=647381 RepID=A0ABP7JBA7_9ACTN|nr:hypothetical protein [Streptomyces coacervatus]MDF2271962.1 hypothetical protein [Streptomyces coacervatus]
MRDPVVGAGELMVDVLVFDRNLESLGPVRPWFAMPTAWPVLLLRETFPVMDQCSPSTLVATPQVLDRVLLYSKAAVVS